MYARIAEGQIQPGKMDEFLKIYRDSQLSINKQAKGFQSVRILTDSNTGKALAVSIWETESDARAGVGSVPELMARFEGLLAGPPTFEYYEVSVEG